MMDTVMVMLVLIVLLLAMSFMAQLGVFFWLFFKGIANSTIYEVTKQKNKLQASPDKIAQTERSEIGRIVDDTARPHKATT